MSTVKTLILPEAKVALEWIQELYAVERETREKDLTIDLIKELRRKKSVEILKKFELWLIDQAPVVLPKSAIGAAVAYVLKLWSRLKRYVDDYRLTII